MSKPTSPKPEEARFRVKVVPRSSQLRVNLEPDNSLKVWVNAPPVDGAANEAVCQLIAKAIGVPKSAVEVVSGATSRNKVIRIVGVSQDTALSHLGPKGP
jgi:uncharacterized protein (TIGR00251 family)